MSSSMEIGGICFYDTPAEIEGSPYWVDLWASANGYRIGLQVKPGTYQAPSTAMYAGKVKSSLEKGFRKFKDVFGGKVFTVYPKCGQVDTGTCQKILQEVERLQALPEGSWPSLP